MNYIDQRRRAADKIRKSGKVVTVRHLPATATGYTYSYDPVLGDTWTLDVAPFTVVHTAPAGLYTDYETWAIELKYDLHDVDGTVILTGDRRFMMAALDKTGVAIPLLTTGDKFVIGTGTLQMDGSWVLDGSEDLDGQKDAVAMMRVINILPLSPGDVTLYYEIQARV